VHQDRYDEFLEAGAAAFDQMIVGDPWDPATNIGRREEAARGHQAGAGEELFAAMGQPELIENARYATNEVRMRHNDELQALVKGWVAERPRDEVLKILDEYEVVCSQVNDASDIVEDPHFQHRTLVELTGSEALGRVLVPGPVLHVEGYEVERYEGVPAIGQHTRDVLGGLLSLGEADLTALADSGTVRLG